MISDLPAALALRLAEHGLRFVVVGSTAGWLRGSGRPPHDLDVVIAAEELPALNRALEPLALAGSPVRRPLDRRVHTTYGLLDVFFGRCRGRSGAVLVEGTRLQVRGG